MCAGEVERRVFLAGLQSPAEGGVRTRIEIRGDEEIGYAVGWHGEPSEIPAILRSVADQFEHEQRGV